MPRILNLSFILSDLSQFLPTAPLGAVGLGTLAVNVVLVGGGGGGGVVVVGD